MQGSLNRHHVSGTVNSGGPTLRASTGSGSITISGNATAAQLRDNNSLHVPGATDCVDNPAQPACRKN
jgi:type IV secretory pathway TrbL component